MNRLPVLIFLLLSLGSCDRVEYHPDKPVQNSGTFLLAHKGGGYFDKGNTLEACIHGLSMMDGIECDIQKSSDNTLWLNHSPLILDCGTYKNACFPSLSDKTIIEIDSCLGNGVNYARLEVIFAFMSAHHPKKFISLDVKAWSPCEISNLNVTRQMNALASKIIELTLKYNLQNQVMVESETGDFLYYVKTHSNDIETYLTTFGDFELGVSRALGAGFSGISFKHNFNETIIKEQVDLIHRKGLKIQVWTVNNPSDIAELKDMGVDIIQTDNF